MQPLFGWVLDLGWSGEVVAGVNIYSADNYHNAMLLMVAFATVALIASTRIRETFAQNISMA